MMSYRKRSLAKENTVFKHVFVLYKKSQHSKVWIRYLKFTGFVPYRIETIVS